MSRIDKKENICIIPARGGSKRIPKKNIKDFCGKPIIAYSIQTALESEIFDRVIVSTNSKEIAEISKKYGAEIPILRSEKNSNDQATLTDVLLELEPIWNAYKTITFILPTAPLLKTKTLALAFDQFQKENAETLVPVCAFSFPIQRAFKNVDGFLQLREPEHEMTRSQDLETLYHDSGSFYILDSSAFIKNRRLYSKKSVPFVLDEMEVQDIDNPIDWKLAEAKYKLIHED